MTTSLLQPRLIVSNGHKALAFYNATLGAKVASLYEEAGRVINADLEIDGGRFSVAEEDGKLNFSPHSLQGSPVLLSLEAEDPDKIAKAFATAGGEVLIKVDDRPYGRRDGRLRDPFGHLWIPGRWVDPNNA